MNRFMLQQSIAVAAVPAVAFVIALFLMAVSAVAVVNLNGGALLEIAVICSGFCFGVFVPGWARDGYKYAQLSWIAPSGVTLVVLGAEIFRLGISKALSSFAGGDSEGIGLFLSLPMISSIGYSVGAVVGVSKRTR